MALLPNRFYQIKFKFLFAMVAVVFFAFGVFFLVSERLLLKDKRLFLMDLNLASVDAASSVVTRELESRLEETSLIVSEAARQANNKAMDSSMLFKSLRKNLSNEILGFSFYRRNGATTQPFFRLPNKTLLEKDRLGDGILEEIDKVRPFTFDEFWKDPKTFLVNRSLFSNSRNLPVVTFLISAETDTGEKIAVGIDMLQTFLMKGLSRNGMVEMSLVSRTGFLLSHPNPDLTVQYAGLPYPHPIVDLVKQKRLTSQGRELVVQGVEQICSFNEIGFSDILVVSQIPKHLAFAAVRKLVFQTLLSALVIAWLAIVVSVLLANGLTRNIKKLRLAADQVGHGNLDVKLAIRSNDEIKNVADSFNWMTERIRELLEQSKERGRMEGELKTAQLVQATFMQPKAFKLDAIQSAFYHVPASECGGDFWDIHQNGKYLDILMGDATGHGAAAAIVVSLVKGCLSTLGLSKRPLRPKLLLEAINRVLYEACLGKHLMTMCAVQVDMESGDVLVSNAGHEAPLCLRSTLGENSVTTVEPFFVRGERLGFDPLMVYEQAQFKLAPADILFLYTDGVTEAKNAQGKEFGERALIKTLSKGGTRSLRSVRTEIQDALKKHMKESPQSDDISYLALGYHLGGNENKEAA